MTILKKIILRPGRDEAVKRGHPWIFSGAILQKEGEPEDGDIVKVCDKKGNILALGHWQDGSIAVRIFSFEEADPNQEFWNSKIQNAYRVRHLAGIFTNNTDCYRLIHAEGDGLPGLVIDIYSKTAVIQCHTIGMHKVIENIKIALLEVLNGKLEAIYDKSSQTLPERYAANFSNGFLMGQMGEGIVSENGKKFHVNFETGQKTGFFLDQRENRKLLEKYAAGKSVLNAFSYSGGFSIYALKGGAKEVHSVDVSKEAIKLVDVNVELNQPFSGGHQSFAQDVMSFLKATEENYDVMILDPPAFAKNISKKHNAVQGYKRLNALGMKKIRKGGILFTFSCSQVVDNKLFYDTIVAAALEAGRKARVLHRLSQPADHPVSLFHPEGEYLKGLVLEIE